MNSSLTQSSIYLTKRRKVLVPAGCTGGCAFQVVATAASNLRSLGFGLSRSLLDRLSTLSEMEVSAWYHSVTPILQQMVGSHQSFSPMYPNFPQQVMEASDAELYFNAVTHYFGFQLSDMIGDPTLVVLPNYAKAVRPEFDEFHELRWIDLGTESDFDGIFTSLAASNGSLSDADKEILRWFIENHNVESLLPSSIPQKETLAFLAAALPDTNSLKHFIRTATDVLRVAVAMSGGDVSLAEPTKFCNFSKRERRFLLSCLEQVGDDSRTEDMLRWKGRWVRLGERLHPGDFRRQFPLSLAAFDTLRNDLPCQTFNARVEQAIFHSDLDLTVTLLVQRPGEFARRLDHLLRLHQNPQRILDAFETVAPNVSTPVLLQAWGHFRDRQSIGGRAFFPKGNAAKVQYKEEPLPPVADGIVDATANAIRKVLIARFGRLPPLGKCFIDERLDHQFVPFSQRSASRSLRSIARGSSFDFPAGDTIRFFCWWKNMNADNDNEYRVDLDLSASIFDDQWRPGGEIAYYRLRDADDGYYHSGDITSAPYGACEFIDISVAFVLARKARYVVMSVLSFNEQPFVAMPECFCGWMMRQKADSGEIFEPGAVQDKIDITASSRACVPVIIDVKDRNIYWADLGLKFPSQINNAANNSVSFSQIGRAIVELNKPTLFDLFAMHVEGRGELVKSPSDAETVFGLYEGTVTAFDIDDVLSHFLA
jgi:hypothetical protein